MNVQEILSNLNNLPVCQNKEISYFLSKTQIKSFLDLLFLITPTQKKILFSLKNNETYIGIGSSTLGNFYFQIVNFDKSIHTKITPALLIHIKKALRAYMWVKFKKQCTIKPLFMLLLNHYHLY